MDFLIEISTLTPRSGENFNFNRRRRWRKHYSCKIAAEGVEALKEVSGSVDSVLTHLTGGIQSGLGYLGAANLAELHDKARYLRISAASQHESKPHDVIEVKAGN